MKTCQHLGEPPTLTAHRNACPETTWDEMRDDPFHGGQAAYRDIKAALVRGQRCLCAHCEIRIADGASEAEIEAKKSEQRVEHFHPKEDMQRPPNWALHWPNLWAVCHGGSNWPPKGEPLNPDKHVEPLQENLSCDAFKGKQIEAGDLHSPPEGWILSPDQVPAFPLLFQFAPDGAPEPHDTNCHTIAIPGNRHPDTKAIVAETQGRRPENNSSSATLRLCARHLPGPEQKVWRRMCGTTASGCGTKRSSGSVICTHPSRLRRKWSRNVQT